MCAAAGATAQTGSAVSAPAADTVLLSQTIDGEYIVRRVLVVDLDDADYSVRYQINLAKLNAMLNGNSRELDELDTFIDNLTTDSLKQVESVTITGYASPDGPLAFNKALAAKRAADFKNYVDKKYDLSKRYDVTVNSVAENWEAAREPVAQSSLSDRQSVLKVIEGSQSAGQKEQALKKMPAAWNYLKKNILPPLRRVEMRIDYAAGNVVEQRLLIVCPQPVPEPQPAPEPCCCVVEDVVNGIIVEMPEEHEYRKDAREMRRDAQGVDRYTREEARAAQKIVRQQEKAARKIAKKEAKAAKKAEKAAKKSYKELEKM